MLRQPCGGMSKRLGPVLQGYVVAGVTVGPEMHWPLRGQVFFNTAEIKFPAGYVHFLVAHDGPASISLLYEWMFLFLNT